MTPASWMDDATGGAPGQPARPAVAPTYPTLCRIPSNDPKEPDGRHLTRLAHVRQHMQRTWDAICESWTADQRRQVPARSAVGP